MITGTPTLPGMTNVDGGSAAAAGNPQQGEPASARSVHMTQRIERSLDNDGISHATLDERP
jgi:hypothetical protein